MFAHKLQDAHLGLAQCNVLVASTCQGKTSEAACKAHDSKSLCGMHHELLATSLQMIPKIGCTTGAESDLSVQPERSCKVDDEEEEYQCPHQSLPNEFADKYPCSVHKDGLDELNNDASPRP